MAKLKQIPFKARLLMKLRSWADRELHSAYMDYAKFDLRCAKCGTWQGHSFGKITIIPVDPVVAQHDVLFCNKCGQATLMFDTGHGSTRDVFHLTPGQQSACMEYAEAELKKIPNAKKEKVLWH